MNSLQCFFHLSLIVYVRPVLPQRPGNGIELKDPTQFPYFGVVKINLPRRIFVTGVATCGGSLIDLEWILTAAHCFPNDDSGWDWIVSHPYDVVYMGSVGHEFRNSFRQTRRIKKLIRHPSYALRYIQLSGGISTYLRNDIALIQVDEPFEVTKSVKPILLSTSVRLCKYGLAIGVGLQGILDDGGVSNVVKYAKLPMKEYEKLTYSFSDHSNTTIYAESKIRNAYMSSDLEYFMHGDSGGPLICDGDDPPVQVGVLSLWTNHTLSGTVINIIERVDCYIDFISKYVPRNGYQIRFPQPREAEIRAGSNAEKNIISLLVIFFSISLKYNI